jgi:Domain of unknown function (DUF4136)
MNNSSRATQRPGRLLGAVLAGWAIMALAACWPGDVSSVQDLDVVLTVHDSTADFSKPTYAMPDTVMEIDLGIGDKIEISHQYDSLILAEVARQMNALGYQRQTPAQVQQNGADYILVVQVSAREVTSYYASYPGCGYWDYWYWGYWGGCWGWYYPPVVGEVTYQVGTVFMDMLEGTVDPDQEAFPRIWIGALNGLLQGSATQQRIISGIEQAYAQSPYLGTTN